MQVNAFVEKNPQKNETQKLDGEVIAVPYTMSE